MKKITVITTAILLSCTLTQPLITNAATIDTYSNISSSLASTKWTVLTSGTQSCSASITAVGIGFALYTPFLPGSYAVSIPAASFAIALSFASLTDSYVEYTQYLSSGTINSNTKLKTVSRYYTNNKYIGTTTTIVTLGSIFNTYSEKDI